MRSHARIAVPETELKFSLHASFALPPFNAAETGVADVEELSPLELKAVYYDTRDLRLARSGITLRYRTGEEDPKWTLKIPMDRKEATREELDFSALPGRVPTPAAELVTAFVRGSHLTTVATIVTKRKRWALRDPSGTDLAELSDDEVSILDGRRVVSRFRELELEARAAKLKDLAPIAGALRSVGAMSAEPIPKAVRALGARATAPPELPEVREAGPDEAAGVIIERSLALGAARMIENDPWARLERAEGVHQLRVAARRMRSDLRTFSDLADQNWQRLLRGELKWFAGVLGAVRDMDVLIERLSESALDLEAALTPLFADLRMARGAAREQVSAALNSDRYKLLLDSVVGAATKPQLTDVASGLAKDVLPDLAAGAYKELKSAVEDLDDASSDSSYHSVRILAKRARYAIEAVTPFLRGKEQDSAARFAKAAAEVQDVLGAHQDAVVAIKTVRSAVSTRPQDSVFAFAAGRLLERESIAARSSRDSFGDAWERLERKKSLRWLP